MENGECVRFWIDNWSPFGMLQEYLAGGNSRLGIPKTATLASLHCNGVWQLPQARTDAQLQVLSFITTIEFTDVPDYYDWEIDGKISDKYRTGEMYHYLRGRIEEVRWAQVVWPKRRIPRHSFHTWMIVQNRLPTRDRMIGWGLQVSHTCLLCNTAAESRDHLFWECNFTFQLLTMIAGRCRIRPSRNWECSLAQMISLATPNPATSLSLLAWQAALYWTWNERNQRLHANQFRSIDSLFSIVDHQLRNKIQSYRETNPKISSAMMQLWVR
ncbi:uncharacterized protein LOC125610035 [Brassica napus]|uniref:uncharacterized protein LOC125610035 n=1 Tax=Brassica napus TaxID=3708 RepID=UPI002078D3EF|nr:uncharacterized protein LOC125610035 [Brassica napus]